MTQPIQLPSAVQEVENVVMETMAEQPLDADHIWVALEARGIQATPGMIHLALVELARGESSAAGGDTERAPPVHGLTRRDLAVIAELAAKVGGVEELRRLLRLVEKIPRGSES